MTQELEQSDECEISGSIIHSENRYRLESQGPKQIFIILTRHAVVYKELNLGTCGPTQYAREKPHQ